MLTFSLCTQKESPIGSQERRSEGEIMHCHPSHLPWDIHASRKCFKLQQMRQDLSEAIPLIMLCKLMLAY